jgi:hypothetical protein
VGRYLTLWSVVEGSDAIHYMKFSRTIRVQSRILAWKAWLEGRLLEEEERLWQEIQLKEG